VPATNIVEVAVVGFSDQRIHRAHRLIAGEAQQVIDQRVGHPRHVQGGSQRDGGFDLAQFLHLGGSSQLPESVAHINRAGNFIPKQVPAVWQHHGDSSADGIPLDERGMAHAHALDIGNGIQRTRRERPHDQSDVACPRARCRLLRPQRRRRGNHGCKQEAFHCRPV
jgi:hypothetical protein